MRLLTSREFAARLAVTDRTVRDWVKKGLLVPACRTPTGRLRFSEGQVEEIVERGRPTERARDIEAHVLSARERLRIRRGHIA
ncbi:MAG: helix-turn-helix domain-containing protein [Planctomycetes bacterium]|nr:helix-turn-helix domain-containing protein [Planctomycetota bacterium]